MPAWLDINVVCDALHETILSELFMYPRHQNDCMKLTFFDKGQITHLICARLKSDLYDFLGGALGPLPVLFLVEKAQKHPLKKSHIDHILGGHRLDE